MRQNNAFSTALLLYFVPSSKLILDIGQNHYGRPNQRTGGRARSSIDLGDSYGDPREQKTRKINREKGE